MELYKIETGFFKLDGGALFGVVPKVLWNKVYPADENNLCNLSLRCLLVKTGNRLILIDTGIGNNQDPGFLSYYFLSGTDTLEKSLNFHGFKKTDISDVILTHLHFDHCGGALEKDPSGNVNLTFPEAIYWVSEAQWQWYQHPNVREKASFLDENILPLFNSGKMKFVKDPFSFSPGINIKLYNGHTQGLIIPYITYKEKTLAFTGDLLPTVAHMPGTWICGYDTQPLVSMDERTKFLEDALEKKIILFFEHDAYHECCTLKNTEKGIRMDKAFPLNELTG